MVQLVNVREKMEQYKKIRALSCPNPTRSHGIGILSHEISWDWDIPWTASTGYPTGYPACNPTGYTIQLWGFWGGAPKNFGSPTSVHQSWALNVVFLLNYRD
jgi:hypothetical protein